MKMFDTSDIYEQKSQFAVQAPAPLLGRSAPALSASCLSQAEIGGTGKIAMIDYKCREKLVIYEHSFSLNAEHR